MVENVKEDSTCACDVDAMRLTRPKEKGSGKPA